MRKLLSMITAAILFCCALGPLQAFATPALSTDGENVVRVFFPLQFGFTQQDEKGNLSGYTYEYLMKIAQFTGWSYEFEIVDTTNHSLTAGFDDIKSGKMDLTGAMTYSPELSQEYTYSSIPYGSTSYALFAKEDHATLNKRTLSDYPNLKVALIEKALGQNGLLEEYCKDRGIRFEAVYANSNEACRALVESGQADVYIGKNVTPAKGFKIVELFASQPFYFATSKENKALMEEFDRVLLSIEATNPDFQTKLYEKYFTTSSDYSISLTADEIAFVKNAPPIEVIVPIHRAPVQDYDPEAEAFTGIVVDLLDMISKKSGLTFHLISSSSASETKNLVESGAVDVVAGIPYSYSSDESDAFLMTSPIFTSPVVRISNTTLKAKSEETLADSGIRLFEDQDRIVYMEDLGEIFSLIENGAYKEAYVNGYMAQHYLERNYFKNVSLTPTPYSNYEICLGVARDRDLKLIHILEQAIAVLRPSEIEDVVYRNTTHPREVRFADVIQRNPVEFVVPVFIVFLLISLLLTLLFLKTRRINKLISAEKNRYKEISQKDLLSQTYNNDAFKVLARMELEQPSLAESALLVCDIDNFKAINDRFGHLIGDEVISGVGQILTETFSEYAIVGRLGGDEFGVFLKEAADAELIAKHCRELLLKSRRLRADCDVTLSIGVASFCGKVSFDRLYQKADSVLYEVKKHGKNSYKIEPLACEEHSPV